MESSGEQEVLKIVYSGEVAAYFYGEPRPLGPPEYGTSRLVFRFGDDPREYRFQPTGTMGFSDWHTELFSYDGSLVALLQDRYGPYHVVKTQFLRQYLQGQRQPDWVVIKPPRDVELDQASVHGDLKWTSSSAFEFTHTCCGDPIGLFWQMPDPRFTRGCDRGVLALYRPDLVDTLPTPPDDLERAYARQDQLNALAAASPGEWRDGDVELGADMRQYRPSDAELLACTAGGELLSALDGKTYREIARNWQGEGNLPPAVSFPTVRFQQVEVMGSGLHYHASAPGRIVFGPWLHGLLPPELR